MSWGLSALSRADVLRDIVMADGIDREPICRSQCVMATESESSTSRFRLGPPVQIAYAVSDVHAAAGKWRDGQGAGPFVISEHIALQTARVRGVDGPGSAFDHSSAYGQWGQIMVELVHEHTAPLGATSGLHHMAFFVDSIEETAAALIKAGMPEVLRASTASGMAFAFHDARAELGHFIEIYEPNERLLGFYAHVRALASVS
jgi:Glyoxalase/Bleomycin resistance protein/Dioxygenase superfamily